jgi:hypothetical protein
VALSPAKSHEIFLAHEDAKLFLLPQEEVDQASALRPIMMEIDIGL